MKKLLTCAVMILFVMSMGAQNVPVPPFPVSAVTFASSGDNTVVAAVTGKGICVYELSLTNSDATTATNITIKNGSTAMTGAISLQAGGNLYYPLRDNAKNPHFATDAGSAFVVNSSAAVQISGDIHYAPCII